MRWLGLISGTSLDAVDAVTIEFTPRAESSGSVLEARVVGGRSTPYPPELRARLLAALPPGPCTAHELTQLDTLVGQHFAAVAASVVEEFGSVDAVSSHGQTTYHWVEDGHALGTMQIGQPAWIAERLGVPVVSDLRARDVAAQGHGAPLVPLLDVLALAGAGGEEATTEVVAALNLGGISNMTRIEPGPGAGGDATTGPSITAYDIGPANALVDAVVSDRGLTAEGYDVGGAIAAAGTVDTGLLTTMLADPYYDLPAPKSTGKEYFHLDLVRAALGDRVLSDADLIATLTRLTGEVVGRELVRTNVARVLTSGGGCDNPVLMRALAEAAPGVQITTTADLGIPTDLKEAFAFALMGWATWHGLPGNVPAATGASGPRVLGSITPGATPLRLPEPLASLPRSLVVVP